MMRKSSADWRKFHQFREIAGIAFWISGISSTAARMMIL
jgi:hypothetical protein